MADLHISLVTIAAAAVINLWLSWRCGQARMKEKILHGDGGNILLSRNMRAHANFIEYAPIALLLVLVLDLAGQDGWLLAGTAILFLLARIAHGFGMSADKPSIARAGGMIGTYIPTLIWIVWAVLVAYGAV